MAVTVAHRLALLTAGATLVLIVFGGLVTNSGAALAVPDWPTTFGHNMFLFPWSQMVGGVFYEHSHRLVGAAVGLLTLALSVALWGLGGRLRAPGLIALAAVIVQGTLGGLRVLLLKDQLAIVHGALAQAFFALVVTLALLTSSRMRAPVSPGTVAAGPLAALAAAVVYAQIVLGALLTHEGWLMPHLAVAVAVFGLVPAATARLRRGGDPVAAPLSHALLMLLGVQLALGVGSYLARFSPVWIPGGQGTLLALPVAHRLVASLMLGAATILAVRTAGVGAPAPSGALASGAVAHEARS